MLLALAGCDRVETLDVEVRSDHEIAIALAGDTCVDRLDITTPGAERTVIWQIEREGTAAQSCRHAFTFPQVPAGFRAVVTADRLPPGQFVVAGIADGTPATGYIDVPAH